MKIAIVGNCLTTVNDAPYDDPAWRIWNMSANFADGRRFDLWFELHAKSVLRAAQTHPAYLEFLEACGDKLVAGHDEWPQAKAYPLKDILALFPRRYFTSSCAYMLAYALHLHRTQPVEEIGVWGVDMAHDLEYGHQKPCCEYYLGVAEGMGIKVTIPERSTLLRANALYAFDHLKLSRDITERNAALEVEYKKKEAAHRQLSDELQYYRGMMNGFKDLTIKWQL